MGGKKGGPAEHEMTRWLRGCAKRSFGTSPDEANLCLRRAVYVPRDAPGGLPQAARRKRPSVSDSTSHHSIPHVIIESDSLRPFPLLNSFRSCGIWGCLTLEAFSNPCCDEGACLNTPPPRPCYKITTSRINEFGNHRLPKILFRSNPPSLSHTSSATPIRLSALPATDHLGSLLLLKKFGFLGSGSSTRYARVREPSVIKTDREACAPARPRCVPTAKAAPELPATLPSSRRPLM